MNTLLVFEKPFKPIEAVIKEVENGRVRSGLIK